MITLSPGAWPPNKFFGRGGEGVGEGENMECTPILILPRQVVATRNQGGG
jgi:hypothetical protein